MSAPLVDPRSGTQAQDDDDIRHIASCHDDDLGICGKDLTGRPWNEEGLHCVVCDETAAVEDCLPDEDCICPCCVAVPSEVSA